VTSTGLTADLPRTGYPRPRLLRLHLLSRQTPGALVLLAACAALLRVAQHLHWLRGDGAAAHQILLLAECAAASVVAVAAHNPFGESERTTGPRLPVLRLTATLLLTATALGALLLAATAAHLPGGALALLRDVLGLTGLGLLTAAALGAPLAWLGPLTYTALAAFALQETWHSPWTWPARPPHDPGAWYCAALAFTVGTALVTARGPRDTP
jgi:hypothetical protein